MHFSAHFSLPSKIQTPCTLSCNSLASGKQGSQDALEPRPTTAGTLAGPPSPQPPAHTLLAARPGGSPAVCRSVSRTSAACRRLSCQRSAATPKPGAAENYQQVYPARDHDDSLHTVIAALSRQINRRGCWRRLPAELASLLLKAHSLSLSSLLVAYGVLLDDFRGLAASAAHGLVWKLQRGPGRRGPDTLRSPIVGLFSPTHVSDAHPCGRHAGQSTAYVRELVYFFRERFRPYWRGPACKLYLWPSFERTHGAQKQLI